MTRRDLILGASAYPLRAATTLEVAYAGSMASVMEGPLKQAAGNDLHITVQGRPQGASGLARLIVSGSIRPDVFIAVTPSPMQAVIRAEKAARAVPIARTEMVIAYDTHSRFAGKLKAGPWWQALEEPGFRFGRTDPTTDPQGRNIIFTMQLAAEYYHQPDLARRILGLAENPGQIFTEPSVQARLQSGQLDAASAYKIQPTAFHLPYIALPPEINLGGSAGRYGGASLKLNGQTLHPEPLVYYAAALKGAQHASEAERFVDWLRQPKAQGILREAAYDPPGDALEL